MLGFFRYLATTFQHAFNYVQPDIVVFLGDLMDEGSVANGPEYDLYAQRFHQIFGTSTSRVKVGSRCFVYNQLMITLKMYVRHIVDLIVI